MNLLEIILENYNDEKLLIHEGFDNAVIGIDASSLRIIYSTKKCIEILTEDMTEEEALDHFYYSLFNIYLGEKTPIFCDDYNNSLIDMDSIKHSKKELFECIQNLMGVFDTPVSRLRMKSDFAEDVRKIARNILCNSKNIDI